MNRIKEARKVSGLSQKYVAVTIGVSGPSVSNWESGKTNPTPENYTALANLFGVSVDYLMGRDEPPKSIPTTREERRARMEDILQRIPDEKYQEALAILEVLAAEQKKEG